MRRWWEEKEEVKGGWQCVIQNENPPRRVVGTNDNGGNIWASIRDHLFLDFEHLLVSFWSAKRCKSVTNIEVKVEVEQK